MASTSGFEAVPWAVDGTKASADIARLLAYAATQGGEGIIDALDCKVSATAGQATNQVHIAPGALVIRNRSANAFAQSYVARATTATHLDVAPTGSSGRSDLVVVRIKDPQFPPYSGQTVAVPTVPEIIPGVPAGTTSAASLGLNQSVYAVARLDIPPNTTNITAGMIKETRQLAQSRTHRGIEQANPTPEQALNSTAGRIWPDFRPQFYIPEWATGAVATATLSSIGLRYGSTQGFLTLVLNGPAQGVGGFRANDIGYDLDAPSQGGSRHTLIVAGGWNDIRSIAGSWREIRLEARSTNTPEDTGDLWTVAGTQLQFDVEFFRQPL